MGPLSQTPKGIQKKDPLEPYGELYKDYMGDNHGSIWGIYFFRSSQGSGFGPNCIPYSYMNPLGY